MHYRIFVVCLLCIVSLVIAACGGESTETTTTQPTSPSSSNPQSPSGSSPAEFAPPSTALTQTINSATGVTYQLPEGWVVQDNESVSNFESDEDAIVDFLDNQKRNARWLLVGSFGISASARIMGLEGITTITEAAPVLSGYFYTEENPIEGPTFITLADGRQAYFVINKSDDILNVTYFMEGVGDTFINLFFSGSESSVNASRDLMNAIANSAVYGN